MWNNPKIRRYVMKYVSLKTDGYLTDLHVCQNMWMDSEWIYCLHKYLFSYPTWT